MSSQAPLAANAAFVPAGASPLEIARLQAEYFATQYAEMARCLEQAMGMMLEAQKAWVQGTEAWTAQWLRPWVDGGGAASPVTARAVFDIADGSDPAQLLTQAQQAWREIGAAWLDALRHDLSGARPPNT